MKHFQALTNAQCNQQGTAFKADLVMAEGNETIEFPIKEVPRITAILGAMANDSAAILQWPKHISRGAFEEMPYVDASSMAFSLGKPGCVTLLVRFGVADLAFSIPHEAFQQAMQELPSALATVAAVTKAAR